MDSVDAGARAWAILFPRSRAVSWTAWTRALGTGPSSSHRGVRCHGRCGRGRSGLDRPLPTASHGVIDGMDVGTRSGLGRPLPTESHSVIDGVDAGARDWVILITLCYRQHGHGNLGLDCPLPMASHGVIDGMDVDTRSGLGRPLPTESHSVIDSVDVGTWDWVVLITLCYRQHGCGHLGLGCPLPTESHGVVDSVVLGSRSGGCVEAVSLPIPCQCGLWSL